MDENLLTASNFSYGEKLLQVCPKSVFIISKLMGQERRYFEHCLQVLSRSIKPPQSE